MSATDTIKERGLWFARDVHEELVNLGCNLGVVDSQQTATVGEYSAEFIVESHKERWRVQDVMGEREIAADLLDSLSPDDVVWDIGSAVGTYALLASDAANHVVAFEPVPINQTRLLDNAALNDADNVDVQAVALSDSAGETRMAVPSTQAGQGAHRIDESGSLVVQTTRGDDLDAPMPDVVKIDVEGHEEHVLDGIPITLAGARRVYIEVHDSLGVEIDDLRPYLQEAGLEVDILDDDRPNETHIRAVRRE